VPTTASPAVFNTCVTNASQFMRGPFCGETTRGRYTLIPLKKLIF
jgi:hypothetical protein